MNNGLTTEILKQGLLAMAKKMETCADELNALDNQVGDGDIGVTMTTGFRAIQNSIDALPEDVGMALLKCAQVFTGTRGSSYGTLLATGLMATAKETKGQTEVAWSLVPMLLENGIEKMAQRGKSQLGQKTVLDALESIRQSIKGIDDPMAMLEAADKGTKKGLDEFRQRPIQQGRARIFADKTIGVDDPGMVVIQKLVEGLVGIASLP